MLNTSTATNSFEDFIKQTLYESKRTFKYLCSKCIQINNIMDNVMIT